jgi:hypothetical protein
MHFFDLDIRSLILLLVYGNLAAVALLLTYRGNGDSKRTYSLFVLGKVLQAGAWFLLAQRDEISVVWSVYLGNALIIAGFWGETNAFISLFDRDPRWVKLQTGTAIAGLVAFFSVAHRVEYRIAVSSLVTVAQFAPLMVVLLRSRLSTPLQRSTLALYGVFVGVVAIRGLHGFHSPGTEVLSPGAVQAGSFLMLLLLMYLGGTAFVLLLKERADAQLAESERDRKILSRLLPICSNCKRIRDDEGYWNQIESYLRSQSGTQFSHGICPDCLRRLYPDLADETLERMSTNRDPVAPRPAS